MKRDMDLVRGILLAVEDGVSEFNHAPLPDRFGSPSPDVLEHIHLLEEAGLIDVMARTIFGTVTVRGLTWAGHDFLDTIRDPEVWKRTKEGATKVGGWSFGLLKDIATAYIKSEAKGRLGLDL